MPDPTALLTGHAGAVLIGSASPGAALTGKVKKWSFKMSANFVESKGAGLAWKLRALISKTWEASVEYEHETGAVMQDYNAQLGADAYIALKAKSSHTNPLFKGTGTLTESTTTVPSDEVCTSNITVKCTKGVAPTVDSTPGS